MSTKESELGPGLGPRKPRAELRHWSTYASVGGWYADYRGYVPIQQAAALGRLTRESGITFRDAYRLLLRRGAIVHLDPAEMRSQRPRSCSPTGQQRSFVRASFQRIFGRP